MDTLAKGENFTSSQGDNRKALPNFAGNRGRMSPSSWVLVSCGACCNQALELLVLVLGKSDDVSLFHGASIHPDCTPIKSRMTDHLDAIEGGAKKRQFCIRLLRPGMLPLRVATYEMPSFPRMRRFRLRLI